eukprot:3157403-Pyramimonas_sp.AAC.1
MLGELIDIVFAVCARHGLSLNPSKTKIMLRFRGRGSQAAHREVFDQAEPYLSSPQWKVKVAVVRSHKCLGIVLADTGSEGLEISA